jgi:hypothetical protein
MDVTSDISHAAHAAKRPAQTTAGESARAAFRRRWFWHVVLVAAYVAAAAPMAYYARDAINPDGVAYVQTARHWAAGRVDLAVNGWFGPLLSWLLVPAVWLGAEPFHVARALGVLYGLLFAAGAARLAAAMGGNRFRAWAFGAALLLSLRTVFAEITPDFLMTAGLTWFFALLAEILAAPPAGRTIGKAIIAGLVGGACYLAKAYALPVVLATAALTAVFRWARVRKEAGMSAGAAILRAALPPAAAMAAAAIVAAPWIIAISASFGRFTTSTAASLAARSWPAGVPVKGFYPHYAIQSPREGRIGAWENPAESKGDWPTWVGGWSFDNQAKAVLYNLKRTFVGESRRSRAGEEYVTPYLGAYDLLMTLALAWAAAMPAAIFWRRGGARRMLWLWGALAAAIYLGGYVVLYLYERFTWGLWGMQVALAAGMLSRLWTPGENAAAPGRPAKKPSGATPAARRPGRIASAILAAIVLISVGYRVAEVFRKQMTDPTSESRMGGWLRQAAAGFVGRGQGARVVSNDWHKGLYFAYWTGSTFLGQYPSPQTRGDDPGRELRPYATVAVLVFEGSSRPELSAVLAQSSGFHVQRAEDYQDARLRLVELSFGGLAGLGGDR